MIIKEWLMVKNLMVETASGASPKIGSGTFIDGFEDQLIGKMPGETVQVKVTFPKDYQGKEVVGKDAVFGNNNQLY